MPSSPPSDAAATAASPSGSSSPPERLTPGNKIAYGLGQVADSLALQSPKQIGNTFYVVMLGVSPAWIGTVLALIRLWDAMIDPLVGRFSDQLRSRHGRRKPMILAGGVAMTVLFPLLWLAHPEWSAAAKTAWFIGGLLLFYMGYATYTVPFQAMGLELAPTYHQRTSIQAYRAFFGAASNIVIWWALPLAFLPVFGNGVTGMRWVSIGMALLILGGAMLPLLVKTAGEPKDHTRPGARGEWRTAIGNRSLRLLVGSVGATFLGTNLAYSITGLLNVYYVFGGDMKASTVVTGVYGTMWTITAMLATPVMARVSRWVGKRATLVGCIFLTALGSLLQLWAFDPAHPYLQLMPVLFLCPGNAGLWVIGPSMLADVCDDDRVRHGVRREATLAALYAWVQKLALSASFALSGYLTVWTGFDVAKAAAQAPGIFDSMRHALAFAPFVALVPALFWALRYPITEAVAHANRAALDKFPAESGRTS